MLPARNRLSSTADYDQGIVFALRGRIATRSKRTTPPSDILDRRSCLSRSTTGTARRGGSGPYVGDAYSVLLSSATFRVSLRRRWRIVDMQKCFTSCERHHQNKTNELNRYQQVHVGSEYRLLEVPAVPCRAKSIIRHPRHGGCRCRCSAPRAAARAYKGGLSIIVVGPLLFFFVKAKVVRDPLVDVRRKDSK